MRSYGLLVAACVSLAAASAHAQSDAAPAEPQGSSAPPAAPPPPSAGLAPSGAEASPPASTPPAAATTSASVPASVAPSSDAAPPPLAPSEASPAYTPPPPSPAAPPVASAAPPSNTAPPEDAHRHESTGREIDFLFIQAEGGFSYIDLTALSSSGRLLPTLTEFRGTGYSGGATVGFRTGFIAVAAHGYIARFDGQGMNRLVVTDPTSSMPATAGFDIGQLMAEVQLRLPVPLIEPYARLGFGYAWLGNFQLNEMYRDSTSDIHGWTGKLGIGADLWIGKLFTVGAGVDLSLLNLRRGGVMRDNSACPVTMPTCVELTMDGDSVGLLVHFHVQAGLHF